MISDLVRSLTLWNSSIELSRITLQLCDAHYFKSYGKFINMASINSCSNTSLQIKTITHKWTIDNFSALTDTKLINGLSLSSPKFPNDSSDLKFHLELCHGSYENNIDIYLITESIINSINTGIIKIWIQGQSNDQSSKRLEYQERFKHTLIKLPTLLQSKDALWFDNKLIINCEITFIHTCISKCGQYCNLDKAQNRKLVEDLSALLETEELTDVRIATGDDQMILAHKNILAARSKVFEAMFKHSMKENAENWIKISDISSVVVKEMLRYIYTGEAPNLKDMAVDLMAAADKYALDGLKAMCAKSMSDNLSIETAPIVLKAADLHNVEDLKLDAIQFIKLYLDEVKETSIWKNFIATDRKLILESFIDQKFLELKLSDDNSKNTEENVKSD